MTMGNFLLLLSGAFTGGIAVLVGLAFLRNRGGARQRSGALASLIAPVAAILSLLATLGALLVQYRSRVTDVESVVREAWGWVTANDFIVGLSAGLIANIIFATIVYRRARADADRDVPRVLS